MESDTEARELTVDEAIGLAIVLQKNAQLDDAGLLLRRVLDIVPDHPSALHYSGVLAHQQGRNDEGIALVRRSLELSPGQADWHSNLGIILQSTGDLDTAIASYERAIAIDPGHANAHNNLGVLLRAMGKPADAEAAYRTAIQRNPEHIDAYTNLGILLDGLKRSEEAAACYCKVITLRPKHKDARKLLALAHCFLGETDEAVKIFDAWLAEEPGDPIAMHLLAACTGRDVAPRASDGFIEHTFDNFAKTFEAKLARLSYRAPDLVAAMLQESGTQPEQRLDVLDAGCGTGLCGRLIAPYARQLAGVDLSEGMLVHAREKQIYDELHRAELTEFLRAHPGAFDVIVSADALVYFGDLAEVLGAAAVALRPNGVLIFTLEHSPSAPSERHYHLHPHGRYSHARAYVERVLADLALDVAIAEAELRMEAGVPVAGLVVRATRPATSR